MKKKPNKSWWCWLGLHTWYNHHQVRKVTGDISEVYTLQRCEFCNAKRRVYPDYIGLARDEALRRDTRGDSTSE